MARTIVYSRPVPDGMGRPVRRQKEDDYGVKLAKYVPAEVLAFFLPTTALAGDRKDYILAICVIGLIGTLLYLGVAAYREKDLSKRPLPHFYVLAVVAFVAWALGSSSAVDKALGVDQTLAALILAAVVFLLPGLDIVLATWTRRGEGTDQAVPLPTGD